MEDLRVPYYDESGHIVRQRFYEFLLKFGHDVDISNQTNQQQIMVNYSLQIEWLVRNNKSTIFVNMNHIREFDFELSEAIEFEYYRFEPHLRHAIRRAIAIDNQHYIFDDQKGQRDFFVAFYNLNVVARVRDMGTDKIGRLVSVSGTVTRSSEVKPELIYGAFVCRGCGSSFPSIEQQFQYTEPQICTSPNCTGPDFHLVMDKCALIDWQRLRVQENADEIPAGSMPRCIDVICRNDIVEVAKAGDKIIITGFVAVVPDSSGLSRAGESIVSSKKVGRGNDYFGDGVSGLKRLGVREMTYKLMFVASSIQSTEQRSGNGASNSMAAALFGNKEEEDSGAMEELSDYEYNEISRIRNTPNLYPKLVESICPSVFGHAEVKRGILLMLFGGVHKTTKEGISLRGDLNVCIVGDPSCAKSQFLKYVHGLLPRTVYTSGKSSSAAGLTASVARDAETGDYAVEAGALMLADNGICCIDEFDKMDPTDQVAIHEAMEQQTISITKAGIQATLNARTSILAAANPVFGRYDRTKTLKANVAVSAAIMSRFDLFFVVLDECNPAIDEHIARHIIKSHKSSNDNSIEHAIKTPFTREQIQKYVMFARKFNPVVSEESKRILVERYRYLRQNDMLGKNKTAYRITVRQLESLVRLSEALARVHLDDVVRPVYVEEAYRLLQKSIIFVETEDIELEDIENEMELINSHRLEVERAEFSEAAEEEKDIENVVEAAINNNANDTTSSLHIDYAAEQSNKRSGTEGDIEPKVSEADTKVKKQKTQISTEEYNSITNLLLLRMKALDDSETDGCKWKDLVVWYLKQIANQMSTGEEFEQKKKLVNQIIRRMIKYEGSLMVVDSTADTSADRSNDEKMLKIHPSIDDEGDVR